MTSRCVDDWQSQKLIPVNGTELENNSRENVISFTRLSELARHRGYYPLDREREAWRRRMATECDCHIQCRCGNVLILCPEKFRPLEHWTNVTAISAGRSNKLLEDETRKTFCQNCRRVCHKLPRLRSNIDNGLNRSNQVSFAMNDEQMIS